MTQFLLHRKRTALPMASWFSLSLRCFGAIPFIVGVEQPVSVPLYYCITLKATTTKQRQDGESTDSK